MAGPIDAAGGMPGAAGRAAGGSAGIDASGGETGGGGAGTQGDAADAEDKGESGGGVLDASLDGPTIADSCANFPAAAMVGAWTADPHFCLIRFADSVGHARQIAFAANGDLFVSTGSGLIMVLFDTNHDGVSDNPSERSFFATVPGLAAPTNNHGMAVTSTHVYGSSETTVYRWTYTSGQRVATGIPETVVQGLGTGGHVTRTLLVDGQNRLYVSIGSATNVDPPADPDRPPMTRAQIRRFDLGTIPPGGYAASAGEAFALGLRNEVGLTFDSRGRLWGVENGRDDLRVGGDLNMFNDNPAEEVNLFDPDRPGLNYGYPFCWSEGIWVGPTAKGAGTQHIDPDQPGAFTEMKCQDSQVVVPPVIGLPAHLAPLDIVEYTGSAYPAEYRGNLFVTSHGAWNRAPARGLVGRLIVRLRTDSTSMPVRVENFIGELGDAGLREGTWALRPVSIRVDKAGLLTFSDDNSNTIHKIGYRPSM